MNSQGNFQWGIVISDEPLFLFIKKVYSNAPHENNSNMEMFD